MSLNAPQKSDPKVRVRFRGDVASDPVLKMAVASFAPQVLERALPALKPSPHNARTHSQKQLHLIAQSIEAFGFVTPILVDGNGEIVAGHGRYEAAKLLGIGQVPTICLTPPRSIEFSKLGWFRTGGRWQGLERSPCRRK